MGAVGQSGSELIDGCEGVGRLEGRDDALVPAEPSEGVEGLGVGDGEVLDTAGVP